MTCTAPYVSSLYGGGGRGERGGGVIGRRYLWGILSRYFSIFTFMNLTVNTTQVQCICIGGARVAPPTNVAGFDSRTRRRMWVEFVVSSRPCSEGFSPGSPVFLPPQKLTFLNSN